MNEIAFNYEPREAFKGFHQRHERFAAMVCHRRAGKTVAAVHEAVLRALYTSKTNARYAYCAPFYRQAKDVAWVYLKDAVKNFAVHMRESALRVELPNGAWITLYGADNPDSMRGIYLDGVVLDEFGDCRPSLWGQVILPTLADRKGWAVFIGTPKGKNHFYHIVKRAQKEKNWFYLRLKASESGILEPEELDEMRAQMTDAEWDQEMECSFTAAIIGTYYASMIAQMELNKAIAPKACRYDKNLPVNVAADIGISDSTALWFWQETPQGINVIDYEEHQGQSLEFYFTLLRAKGYKYGNIWLPHDAKAKTLQTGRSTVEQFVAQNFVVRIVPHLKVQHGIDAVRLVLPHLRIDSEKCFNGIEALRAYRRQYNELNKCYIDKPLHDWSSNGSDSARYMCLVCREKVKVVTAPKPEKNVQQTYNTYGWCLNDLHKEREKNLRFKARRL